ncbi:MAG TPA: hypothetical protein VEY14_03105 [Nocardioidaceae bacterium]|nr:hypothetical protein [Nocardioidaceae bacterium]
MTLLRTHGWRIALVTSAAAALVGGPMHPSADAEDPLREELATMTAHPNWVPAHSLLVLSAVLLAIGLAAAYRGRAWPTAHKALGVAALAVSLYVVETIFHLAAAVDSHELHHGDQAPVAYTHLGLSVLLYPLAGLAIAYLASRQVTTWRGPRRVTGVPGVVGGTLHALAVPLTLAQPTAELTPVFAGATVLIAVWSLATGLAGAPAPVVAPPSPALVTV